MQRKVSGKSGGYLRVRKCDSLRGLSLLVCGGECDLVTPRSARRNATGLDAMDEPLSAWMGRGSRSMFCLAMVSARSFSARILDSASAISHPTTYREDISMMTYRE